MKNRKFILYIGSILIIFILGIALFCVKKIWSDGGEDDMSFNKSKEVSNGIIEEKLEIEVSETVKRSLLNLGNTYRIHQALDKMKQGELTKIAFLGGSITEGYLVNANQNYVAKTIKWLQEEYQNPNIKSVNAGLSGTSSTIGLLRVEQDVLAEKPDVIVIEFAVNDSKDTVSNMAYESLVKRCLEQENKPAVILLFTVLENGYSCEEEMKKIGDVYQLPMLSVKEAITKDLEDGNLTWSTYAQDEAHPTKEGHTMIKDYLAYYFECASQSKMEAIDIDYTNLRAYGSIYSNLKFYNNQNLYPESLGGFLEGNSNIVHFPNGWVWNKEAAGSFTFTMKGRNLFLLYKEDNSENMGNIEVYMDGKKKETVYGNSPSGWNNPEVALLLNEVEEGEHTVELRMSADSIQKNFHILGLGTTGEIYSVKRVTKDMIPLEERAILNVGNTKRIQNLMARANNGEDITVGFIGGSITMGSGASSSEHCYAKQVFDWWCESYPNSNVTFVNAGIGATTSQFACARVWDDLLQYEPDFVVVEFSVNDDSRDVFKDSYESLLRGILSAENQPAVMVLNMVSYNNGNNVQTMHNEIARAYDLPIVSMKESVFEEILLGKLTPTDVSGDNLHPNDVGHTYGARIVTNYLEKVKQGTYTTTTEYEIPEKRSACVGMTLTRYNNTNITPMLEGFVVDPREQHGITDVFKRGFTAKNEGDRITFEVAGGNISIQYKRTNSLGAPKAIAIIDGNEEKAIALDGNFVDGWGDWLYMHDLLVNGENGKHSVEIRIIESGEKDFNLVSIIVGESDK